MAPSVFKLESSELCRNIRVLFNFDPPATEAEIRDASLQFVRKISGFSRPSKTNEQAFLSAVDKIAGASVSLLRSLETDAQPKNRESEIAKAKARSASRFSVSQTNRLRRFQETSQRARRTSSPSQPG